MSSSARARDLPTTHGGAVGARALRDHNDGSDGRHCTQNATTHRPDDTGPKEPRPDTFHDSTLHLCVLAYTSPMGAREPFRANVRDRTESVASLSVIAATRPGTRPVVSTTGSFVVAMLRGPADGRQEPQHVALEASDQPILQPAIGGIAKRAGFAERR